MCVCVCVHVCVCARDVDGEREYCFVVPEDEIDILGLTDYVFLTLTPVDITLLLFFAPFPAPRFDGRKTSH